MSRLTTRLAAAVAAAVTAAAAGTLTAAEPAGQTQFINEQIAAKWKEADIKKPAAKATDAEFLRRAFLDLIGRVATPEECLDFEQDTRPDKRARLVHRLLYDTEYQPRVNGNKVPKAGGGKGEYLTFDYAGAYAEHWANVWTNWLMSRTGLPQYRDEMRVWLELAFLENRPYNELVTELLTATGRTGALPTDGPEAKKEVNGAVNFIAHHIGDQNPPEKRGEHGRFDAVPITSRVTRLFLGLQTQCTQCHDHPFNKEWVQADFWGVNAFFRQVDLVNANGGPGNITRPTDQNNMMALANVKVVDRDEANKAGIVFYERRDGKLMAAKPNFLKDKAAAEAGTPSNKTLSMKPGKTRREALAEYVVGHDNFGPAYVNRVWGHLFGRGLNKEPSIDDFGSQNEVVHPELLAGLADEFKKYKYDPKMLLEWICCSDAYSLSHVGNKEYVDPKYDPYFARMPLKALSPEELFESLMTATQAEALSNKQERQTLRDAWMRKLVRNFGDDEGNEMTFNGTVVQALLMMNGKELNEVIGEKGNNVVAKVVAKHTKGGATSAALVLDELFLMALNRKPTADERTKLLNLMKNGAVVKLDDKKDDPKDPPASPGKPPRKGPKPADPVAFVPGTSVNDVSFYQDVFWALLNTGEFMLNH